MTNALQKPQAVPVAIGLISLLAIPFSYAVANIRAFHDNPGAVLGVGALALILPAFIAYGLVFRHMPDSVRKDPFLYIFTIFAFACVLDLLIGFTLLGWTDVMAWYFSSGEPYLNTAHGMAINLWDGTVHYALYLLMAYLMATGRSYRRAGLFWAGSMLGSGMVFLVGNLVGSFADHVEPPYLLNVPFMLVPLFLVWRIVEQQPEQRTNLPAKPANGILSLLSIGLLATAGFSLFRLLVALNPDTATTAPWAAIEPYLQSPLKYGLLQVTVYAFWLMPFCLIAALSLWRGGSVVVSNWSWVFLGLVAQGQFGYIIAASSAKTETAFQIPAENTALFLTANIAILLVVAWYAVFQDKNPTR